MTLAQLDLHPLTSTGTEIRCVVYVRISRDIAGLGLGVERQLQACREQAEQRGWTVVAVLTENDMSATRGKRPRYAELVRMLGAGEVDVVLSWAQDRLLRKPLEMETLIALAEQHPFTIAGVVDAGTDLSTSSGRHHARMSVANSRAEIERKSERQVAANLQRAQKGQPPARRAFGYRQDGTIIPAEAGEVRDAYARFVAGAGIKTITTDWNNRGIVNTHGSPWTLYGVNRILNNPRYIAERWLDRKVNGRVEPIFIGPGNWEPIIDADTFQAARTKLADPARRLNTNGITRKHFGSGLYLCGVCKDGTRVKAWQEHNHWTTVAGEKRTRVKTVYLCRKAAHLARKAADVDEYVKTEIVAYLRKYRLADLLADDRDVKASRALRDEELGLLERLESLEAELATGTMLKVITGAVHRIEQRLDVIRVEQAKHGARSALALLEGSTDPGAVFLALPVSSQNKVAGDLAEITLDKGARGRAPFDPATVTITWRV